MSATLLAFAEIFSTTNNQVALIAFCLMLMLAGVLIIVLRMLNSFMDFKREVYKAQILPDRGEKGKRY
jgi:ABC-type antimicrobial peptide transport system permease subunit